MCLWFVQGVIYKDVFDYSQSHTATEHYTEEVVQDKSGLINMHVKRFETLV